MLPVNHNQVQLVEAQATIRATNERIVHLWLSRKSEKNAKGLPNRHRPIPFHI